MSAVVAIGGGHGLAATLRAASTYADDLTAVVTVADDGGSTGRLRESTGLPAMGDLRLCLTSLATPGSTWATALERRIDGHAVGNLVIAALAVELGDFTAALDEVRRVLGVRARILPATSTPVTLVADTESGRVRGQVAVHESSTIKRIALDPCDPPPTPAAVEAIAAADQIVIGPGSLFTSVLAALAVPGIREAVATAPARRIFVANLRPQLPETAGFDVDAQLAALRDHGVEPDIVLTHEADRPLARPHGLAHDPALLGAALEELSSP